MLVTRQLTRAAHEVDGPLVCCGSRYDSGRERVSGEWGKGKEQKCACDDKGDCVRERESGWVRAKGGGEEREGWECGRHILAGCRCGRVHAAERCQKCRERLGDGTSLRQQVCCSRASAWRLMSWSCFVRGRQACPVRQRNLLPPDVSHRTMQAKAQRLERKLAEVLERYRFLHVRLSRRTQCLCLLSSPSSMCRVLMAPPPPAWRAPFDAAFRPPPPPRGRRVLLEFCAGAVVPCTETRRSSHSLHHRYPRQTFPPLRALTLARLTGRGALCAATRVFLFFLCASQGAPCGRVL